MANDKNFYEWLELPVEKFEYDYEFLKNEADKHIRSWISSKSNELQGRAQLYKDEIQEAIKSQEEWRKIYDEYAQKVHATVSSQVDMCSEDLTDEVISIIVSENRVSEGYVNKIIAEKGLSKRSIQSTYSYSLKDLLPDTAIVGKLMAAVQRQLEEYDCKDITDFIKKEANISLLLENTSKEEIINALNQIQKKWKNKQSNRAKAIVDKVVSGFKGFLNDKDVKDYIAFLKYYRVEDILSKKFWEINKLKRTALNEKAFNTTLNDIYFVVEDKEKARGILENFCTEKKIGFPKRPSSVAVCPFCGSSFEESNPIQTSCLACGKTFVIKCPKCTSEKNLLVDLTCDGVDLQRYPILERQLEDAKGLIESLALKEGRHKISKIQKEWTDFPGTDTVEEECRRIEKDYGADLNAIETNKKERKLYSAKMICDRISRSFPKAKEVYEDIYIAISEFEKEIALYKKETNRENKIAMLLNLSKKVADSAELNAELGNRENKIAMLLNLSKKVTDDFAEINEERGRIVILCNKSEKEETVCIFDLGGGTFDVTAMKIGNNKYEVLTTAGNHDLGGKLWDAELINIIEEKFRAETGYSEEFESDILRELQYKCEVAKKQLSSATSVSIPISIDRSNRANVQVTREEFDNRTEFLLSTAIDLTKEVFERVEEKGLKIDKILLVGGSTFMPQVRERLDKEFGLPLEFNEPNEATSKGVCVLRYGRF